MGRAATVRSTTFKRRIPERRHERQWIGRTGDLTPPKATMGGSVSGAPVPKDEPIQDERYMAVVRKMRCFRCHIEGYTQFCHSDEGKGLSIKSDCRYGWPGCGPHPIHDGSIDPGCHWFVGTSGKLSRAERRAFEACASAETRDEVWRAGLWPPGLPTMLESS